MVQQWYFTLEIITVSLYPRPGEQEGSYTWCCKLNLNNFSTRQKLLHMSMWVMVLLQSAAPRLRGIDRWGMCDSSFFLSLGYSLNTMWISIQKPNLRSKVKWMLNNIVKQNCFWTCVQVFFFHWRFSLPWKQTSYQWLKNEVGNLPFPS